jgi:hypothetical protein
MTYDIRYRSSRAEIWRWYWCAWKAGLWRVHVFGAAVTALATMVRTSNFRSSGIAFLIVLPSLSFVFALIPQLMFKSSERSLQVGPEGWSTQIGRQSASRAWAEVASIREASDAVVITGTNGNALVVPLRAFPDRASLQRFAIDSQAWRNAAAG